MWDVELKTETRGLWRNTYLVFATTEADAIKQARQDAERDTGYTGDDVTLVKVTNLSEGN